MEKIGVGLIGVGWVSDYHAKGYLQHPNSEIVAVADVIEERAKEKTKAFGAKKYYTDYRKLLKDDAVDAVDISLPHYLHPEVCVAAAEEGKHIYIEKPMAITVKECDRMIAAARKTGIKLMVGFQQLLYPPHIRAKEIIDQGEIGRPLIYRGRLGIGLTNIKENPPIGTKWRIDPKLAGGGIVIDSGHHKLYTCRYFMGEVDTIWSVTDHIEPNLLIEDISLINFKFVNGSYGIMDMSFHNPSKPYTHDDRTEIIGTEGIIFLGGCERTIDFVKGPLPLIPLSIYKDGKYSIVEDVEADWYKCFIYATQHFIDCIIKDEKPISTGEDGRRIVQMVEAIYKSAKEGKAVKI